MDIHFVARPSCYDLTDDDDDVDDDDQQQQPPLLDLQHDNIKNDPRFLECHTI